MCNLNKCRSFFPPDKSHAQTVAVIPQRDLSVFLRQPASAGSDVEAVQHQGPWTECLDPILAGTVVIGPGPCDGPLGGSALRDVTARPNIHYDTLPVPLSPETPVLLLVDRLPSFHSGASPKFALSKS